MNAINFDFQKRREKLKEFMKNNEILLFHTRDVMMKEDGEFFHSCDSMWRYFFSNTNSESMVAMIVRDEDEIKVYIGVEEKSEIQKRFEGEISTQELAEQMNINTQHIVSKTQFTNILEKYLSKEDFKLSCVYDEKRDYFSQFQRFLNTIQKQYNLNTIENKFKQIAQIRQIKDEEEIEAIKQANKIAQEVFEEVLKSIHNCETEQEVFATLSYEIYKRNSEHAFYPIVASGKNALTLHYTKHNQPLNNTNLLLLDFGCEFHGYKSDISRTIPLSGSYSKRQQEVYEAVLRVQEYAISLIQEGVKFKEYETQVAKKMGEELVKLKLITQDELEEDIQYIRQYFPHRCSHFLGLDTHDVGEYNTMQAGMVLTVEPGVYIEEEGIGIRIEDNVVVKENDCENLSNNIIKSVEDITKKMKK
ncbi:MAG: aminopeptidase P N-terminal domain-containing protein [Candidatus Nanoarchaeia archaeon]